MYIESDAERGYPKIPASVTAKLEAKNKKLKAKNKKLRAENKELKEDLHSKPSYGAYLTLLHRKDKELAELRAENKELKADIEYREGLESVRIVEQRKDTLRLLNKVRLKMCK